MNRKGEGVAGLILTAVGLIICILLLSASAANLDKTSAQVKVVNATYEVPTAGTYTELSGQQEVIGTYNIRNATNANILTTNMTLESVIGSNGQKTLVFYNHESKWEGINVNLTYTYGAIGYMPDAGSRGVTAVIIVLSAVALVVFAIQPAVRDYLGF